MLGSLAADAPHVMAAVPAPAATVSAGGCAVSPLPLDTTCSGAARRLFRAAAAGVGLSAELIYDGSTMASELAANSMHAQTGIQFDVRGCAVAGAPEIWLYLRRVGGEQELVCKVFDALPRWKDDAPPDLSVPVPVDAVSGRGLHVIDGSTITANLGVNPSLTITALAERATALWPNKGQADPRPPLGSPYVRVDAVAPARPAVPSSAPGALQFAGQDASGR